MVVQKALVIYCQPLLSMSALEAMDDALLAEG
jgi:hypothetical protein